MRLMDEHHSWAGLFEAFEHARRPNTDAIAQMALENYVEMREAVLDPEYRQEEGGSGRAGEEGSELHPAVFDGDVSPGDFVFGREQAVRRVASNQLTVTRNRSSK